MAIDYAKLNVKDLQGVQGIGNNNQGGTKGAPIDQNMTMGGSIFNKVGIKMNNGISNKKEDKKEGPSVSDEQLMSKGKNSTTDAKTATEETEATSVSSKSIISQAPQVMAETKEITANFNANVKKSVNFFNTTGKEIAAINKENEANEVKMQDLNNEKESLLSGNETGVGKASAFSLAMPGLEESKGSSKDNKGIQTRSADEPQEEGAEDPNQERIAEIDNELGVITSSQNTNTTKLATFSKQTETTKQLADRLAKQASTKQKQGVDATNGEANSNNTFKIASGVTVGVSTVTAGVGAALAAGVFTAPASPPPTAAGATGISVGNAGIEVAKTAAMKIGEKMAQYGALTAAVTTGTQQITQATQKTKQNATV